MPNVLRGTRQFMPLLCYLLTGTAVTTVSQIISNKVIGHTTTLPARHCYALQFFFQRTPVCAAAALHERLCSSLGMCEIPEHSGSQPGRLGVQGFTQDSEAKQPWQSRAHIKTHYAEAADPSNGLYRCLGICGFLYWFCILWWCSSHPGTGRRWANIHSLVVQVHTEKAIVPGSSFWGEMAFMPTAAAHRPCLCRPESTLSLCSSTLSFCLLTMSLLPAAAFLSCHG